MSEGEAPRIRAVLRPAAPGDEDASLALRCPYCHDVCEPGEHVSCRDCHAPHHPDCWLELEACSVCRARYRVEDGPERIPKGALIERLYRGRRHEVEAYYREQGQDEDRARASAAALAFEELARVGPQSFRRQKVPTAARVTAVGQAVVLGLCAHNADVAMASRSVVVAGLTLVFALVMMLSVRQQSGPAANGILLRQLGLCVLAPLALWLIVLNEAVNLRGESDPVSALCLLLGLGSILIAIPGRRSVPSRLGD